MSTKKFAYDSKVTDVALAAAKQVLSAVKGTMGPEGHAVAIQSGFGPPKITKDGVTVVEAIELKDPEENTIAQAIKEAARATNEIAGDGTTGATVVTCQGITEGLKHVTAGFDALGIGRGMKQAASCAVEAIKDLSRPCTDAIAIEQVGTISANGDKAIGKMLASAVDKVGKDGVIMVQEGNGIEDTLEIQVGMQYDRGYLSPYFVTDAQSNVAELDNPYILIADKKISNIRDILKVFKNVVDENRALFIIAESVEGDALPILSYNRSRGVAKVCAVKSPGFGDDQKAKLQDIAIFTGGQVISDDSGLRLENADIEHLGSAKKVIVKKDSFTIIEGSGEQTAIDARVNLLKQEHEAADSSYEKEKKQERLAKLAGGIAVIKVGAPAELEMKEKKYRLEDALNATRAAIEEGIVPGGGVALLRAAKALDELKGQNADEDAGIAIIKESLKAPLRCIVENTGREAAVIVNEVANGIESTTNSNYGYNAAKDTYGDMIEMGIIDPTKVIRTALEKAASVAAVVLSIRCIMTDLPKEEAAPGGGMPGGMGGMDM